MPNSYVTFTGNGSNRTFSFAGIDDYLSTGYIKVYLNNQLVDPANYTIDTSGGNENVVFTIAFGAPESGVIVKLARETPSTSAGFAANIVDFSDGAVLTATDLDKGFKGMLHIVQEANDTGSGALPKAANGLVWDANKLRVSNAAAALETNDLVTKSQLDAATLFGSAATVPQAWSFTGTGNSKEFTLSPEALTTDGNMFIVEVGGVIQRPNSTPPDYTISAAKITFDSAPALNARVTVRNFGVARTVLDGLPNSSVTTQYIADGAVTETKLAANSVTSSKLADSSVDTAALQSGSVTAEKMATNAIATASIQNLAVTTDKIAAEAVTTNQLGNLSVDTRNIASGAVTSDKIANNGINYINLNQNSVGPFTSAGVDRYLKVNSSGVLSLAAISSIPVGTPTADVTYGSTNGSDGFTNTNLRTPTNARDAATKGYVDALVPFVASTVIIGAYPVSTATTAPTLGGQLATYFELTRTGAGAAWWPRPKSGQGTWTMLNFNLQPGNTAGNGSVALFTGATNATTATELNAAFGIQAGGGTVFDVNAANTFSLSASDANYIIAVRTA